MDKKIIEKEGEKEDILTLVILKMGMEFKCSITLCMVQYVYF
jgi:hypothetical protein